MAVRGLEKAIQNALMLPGKSIKKDDQQRINMETVKVGYAGCWSLMYAIVALNEDGEKVVVSDLYSLDEEGRAACHRKYLDIRARQRKAQETGATFKLQAV